MRSGIIARKVGMTRVFADDGRHVPVTVLHVDKCQVVARKTDETDGYNAVQLGVGAAKVKRTSKQMRGHFAKAQVEPKQKLTEFRVTPDALLDVGVEILVDHFADGQKIDVSGTTIGKGFAGAMKRHNFKGLRASHGVSVSHRSHGSTGNSQDPGRVWKGKKMAGHMGNVRVTTQNLTVFSTDVDERVILVEGAVPGSKGSFVFVQDAHKSVLPKEAPFPASIRINDLTEKSEPSGENKAATKDSTVVDDTSLESGSIEVDVEEVNSTKSTEKES